MANPMSSKHSQAELTRIIESGIRDVGDLDPRRFFVLVRNVIASGSPPDKLRAAVLVRFLRAGAPYCCGEPVCYSGVFGSDGMVELGDYARRKMNLLQPVEVELNTSVEYYEGIVFTAHR